MWEKIFSGLILSLVITASVFIFGTSDERFLTKVFLGFMAIIICFQLVPVLVLFGAMIKGFLQPAAQDAEKRFEEE